MKLSARHAHNALWSTLDEMRNFLVRGVAVPELPGVVSSEGEKRPVGAQDDAVVVAAGSHDHWPHAQTFYWSRDRLAARVPEPQLTAIVVAEGVELALLRDHQSVFAAVVHVNLSDFLSIQTRHSHRGAHLSGVSDTALPAVVVARRQQLSVSRDEDRVLVAGAHADDPLLVQESDSREAPTLTDVTVSQFSVRVLTTSPGF